jgi:hypothetical protein
MIVPIAAPSAGNFGSWEREHGMVCNRIVAAVFGSVLLASMGCTMCPQAPDDYAYAAYGGILDRADRFHGRVGSAFAPAEGAPGPMMAEPIPPYDAPAPMPAEAPPQELEAAPPGVPAAQSQPAATAFDPGDLLSSNEN